jgi:hypothetical protein
MVASSFVAPPRQVASTSLRRRAAVLLAQGAWLALKLCWPSVVGVATLLTRTEGPATGLLAAVALLVEVPWLAFLLRRSGRLGGDEGRALARRLGRRAPEVFRACGLATLRRSWTSAMARLAGESGSVREVLPRVVGRRCHAAGVVLRTRLVDGQTIGDFEGRSDALATAWRVNAVRALPTATRNVVDLLLVTRDPLEGVHPLELGVPSLAPVILTNEDGARMPIDLVTGGHCAIQGQTRSGKSVLTYDLLASVAGLPTVLVAGSDISGILLAPWDDAPGRNMRAVGGADLSAHGRAFAVLVNEMRRRLETLARQHLDSLPISPEDPMILVVVEEAPGLLAALADDDSRAARKPSERLETQVRRDLGRLLREGAKVGIRVLLLAQRFDAALLGGDLRAQFATRVTLRVDNPDAVRLLHPSASPAEIHDVALFLPGQALVQLPGTPPQRCRADIVAYGTYYDHITELWQTNTNKIEES